MYHSLKQARCSLNLETIILRRGHHTSLSKYSLSCPCSYDLEILWLPSLLTLIFLMPCVLRQDVFCFFGSMILRLKMEAILCNSNSHLGAKVRESNRGWCVLPQNRLLYCSNVEDTYFVPFPFPPPHNNQLCNCLGDTVLWLQAQFIQGRGTSMHHYSAAMWRLLFCCVALVFLPDSVRSFSATSPRASPQRNSYHGSRYNLRHLGSLPHTLETLVKDALDSDRKIVVVTGGVLSGIGKGVTASSIGVVSYQNNQHSTFAPHIPLNLVEYYCSFFEPWDIASLP